MSTEPFVEKGRLVARVPEYTSRFYRRESARPGRVTIISAREMTPEMEEKIREIMPGLACRRGGVTDFDGFTGFGISDPEKTGGALFVPGNCPVGDQLRKALDLPVRDFYLSIDFGGADRHQIDKSIRSIDATKFSDVYEWKDLEDRIVSTCQFCSSKGIDQLRFLNELGWASQETICGFAGTLARKELFQEALSVCADIEDPVRHWAAFAYIHDTRGTFTTEDGPYVYDEIKHAIINLPVSAGGCENASAARMRSWDAERLISTMNRCPAVPRFVDLFESNGRRIVMHQFPKRYSELDERVCGSGKVLDMHVAAVRKQGVRRVICLLQGHEICDAGNARVQKAFDFRHYFVPDGTWEDVGLLREIVGILRDGDAKTLVHCFGGIGRTNVVLCAYLMARDGISPDEAVEAVGRTRPCKLSRGQMAALEEYYRGEMKE